MYERKKRPPTTKAEKPKPIPPRTEAEEEKRACGLAMDLAIKWMEEGTAPSQVVVHFLKLASIKEQTEVRKLEKEIALLESKKLAIDAMEEQTKKYDEVMRAMHSYLGKDSEWETIYDEGPAPSEDYRPYDHEE